MSLRDETEELRSLGRAIVDESLYMVMGTADATGQPWVTPVYFACDAYRDFLWLSRPEARHSRNLAVRPQLSIAIFDSSAPISTGRGVYVVGTSKELTGAECATALEVYSWRAVSHGGRSWTLADVEPPAGLRLYCATASEQYVLDELDRRVPVSLQRQ